MRSILTFLCLLTVVVTAASIKVPFSLPDSPPFTASLVLPESGTITSHKRTESGDSIRAGIGDTDDAGLLVEITDPRGHKLWSHDFGFNLSALPAGCEIEVSYSPTSRLLLVHYQGYKWDHAHKLLFVELDHGPPAVREYSSAEKDILPLLKRQKDFASDYTYWIYPLRFAGRGVEFECIPLQKPERQAAHPFAQDQQWYLVTATVDANHKIVPTDVKTTR